MRKLFFIIVLTLFGAALTIPAYGQRKRIKIQTVVVVEDSGKEVTYVNLQKPVNRLLASRKMRRNRQILLYKGPHEYRYFANIHNGELIAPTVLNGKGEELEFALFDRVWHFPDESLGGGDDGGPDAAGNCYEDDYDPCMICIEDADYPSKMTCYYHCCKIIYLPN